MKQQKSYMIVCVAIISISFFAVNAVAGAPLTRLTGYIWMLTVLFLLFGIAASVLYIIKKSTQTYRINLITLSLFLILNMILLKEVFILEYTKYRMSQIEKIDTCEKAQLQFDIDLKNQSLKYFTFGMGVDEEYQNNLEDKYNLEVYHMGCIVENSYECYNEHVEKHLKMISISLHD